MQPLEDSRRNARRPDHLVARRNLFVIGKLLPHGRYLGQAVPAFRAHHCENPHLARAHLRNAGGSRRKRNRNLAGHQRVQPVLPALVRHVNDVHAELLFQQFHIEVVARAHAVGSVGELAWVRPRGVDQILHRPERHVRRHHHAGHGVRERRGVGEVLERIVRRRIDEEERVPDNARRDRACWPRAGEYRRMHGGTLMKGCAPCPMPNFPASVCGTPTRAAAACRWCSGSEAF